MQNAGEMGRPGSGFACCCLMVLLKRNFYGTKLVEGDQLIFPMKRRHTQGVCHQEAFMLAETLLSW